MSANHLPTLFFRDRGMASVHGTICYSRALSDAVNDYWGSEFLNALFSETRVFPEWLSCIHKNKMGRFLPLQHILLMCVVRDSAEGFVNSEVVENPFGNAPYICENLICEHYHVGGADCTEVRNFSSRAVGFFRCSGCGMRYKKTKEKRARGIPIVLDYGHMWISELIRCIQDKDISITKTAKILKCSRHTIRLQKKKLGLQQALHSC